MTSTLPSSATLTFLPAVKLDRVAKLYSSFVALRDISLTLRAGSSVMLLGPNGSGKSTLLKLLAGLTQPSYGAVHVFGTPPATLRGRIAYMGHSTMLYDELTGAENLHYLLGLQRPALSRTQRTQNIHDALAEVALDPANPRRLGEYSQGMRQRASLARVLLTDPDLLLLDEPFSNLDTTSVSAMISRLQRYLSQPSTGGRQRTLVFTTHQAELARALTAQTLTLQEGRLVDEWAAPARDPAQQST